MSRKTEIQVGATVLGAIAILLVSLAWLKDYSLHRGKRVWHVEFPQTGGLSPSDEVQVNGIRKGDVLSMKLVGDEVRVDLSLDSDIVLTRHSVVAIRNVGLMGEKIIAVDLVASGPPYGSDEVIPGVYEKGMSEVMGQIGATVDAVARLSARLDTVATALSREGRLSGTLQNFSRASEELTLAVSENRATLREALGNFASASRTARRLTADREAQLVQAVDKFASAADKMDVLASRIDSLRAVLQSVGGRVDRGEGTLGKLVNDERLYAELNTSVQSFKALIEDIKKHPRKYLKFSVF